MNRAAELSMIVRAAAQRIRVNQRHMPERRSEWQASIKALMSIIPGGEW
jgi:hypothetical protein